MSRLASFLCARSETAVNSLQKAALREVLAYAYALAGDVPAAEQAVSALPAQHGGTRCGARILPLKQFLCMARLDTAGVDLTIAEMAAAGYGTELLRDPRAHRASFLRIMPRRMEFRKLRLERYAQQGADEVVPMGLSIRNHPNPFNPSTTITYHMPERAHALLTVWSPIGRRIAVLSDAVRERGEHAVIFDAGIHAPGAGSGVYFIVLSTPERTVARAMHLVR
jgi:hypothetical protein